MKDDFEIYRNVIRKLTYKYKKELFNNWDGYDYYDGEYIKEYLSLHNTNKKYPTIDHKMSLYYGFNNNIPPYIIGNIENLCITKRTINSSKCSKNIYKKINKIMENYVKIINIIDRSGSMSSILESAINGFNEFIIEQKNQEGDAVVSTYMFSSDYKKLYENVNVKECNLLDKTTFIPGGMTALYDAIGYTIDNEIDILGNLSVEERPIKTLCVILTDGYENSSKKYSSTKIKEMISEMKKDFDWEFIFLAANEEASFTAETIGISKSNSYAWSNDSEGVKDAYRGISYATKAYRSSVNMDTMSMSFNSETLMDEYKTEVKNKTKK